MARALAIEAGYSDDGDLTWVSRTSYESDEADLDSNSFEEWY